MAQWASSWNRRQFTIRILMISLGTLIWVISVSVFLAPVNIAPAGITGLAVILNNVWGTPIGVVVLLGNIPIQILAYKMLGGWRPVLATIYAVVLFTVLSELLAPYFPTTGISTNPLLNAIFGGLIGGLGGGITIKAGGTSGGTSTLARILQARYGLPLSTTFLYTNLVIVALAGVVFGWEGALYAMVALAAEGAATDYVLEGPSVVRTGILVTTRPKELSEAIMTALRRGVTGWEVVGMYTGQPRTMLFVTVARFQIDELRQIVAAVDPEAFVVIGQGHVAYGEGFLRYGSLLDSPRKADE